MLVFNWDVPADNQRPLQGTHSCRQATHNATGAGAAAESATAGGLPAAPGAGRGGAGMFPSQHKE